MSQIENQEPLVSVIIVNWNGKKWLKKCLDSLCAQTYKNFEIILVDNGSSDDSVVFIKENYSQVVIVQSDTNLGFAGGNNLGIQHAHGKYVLLLNNDTEISQDGFYDVVDYLEKNNTVGALQLKILLMDRIDRLDGAGSFLTNTGILYHYGYLKEAANPRYKKVIPIYSAKGAALIFRVNILEKTGGLFDEDYFLYFEETDFCHRVWLAGFDVVYFPFGCEVLHAGGGSSQASLANSFTQYYSYRNRIITYLKNLGPIELIKVLPIHLFLVVCSSFIFLLRNNKDVFFAIYRALGWCLMNLNLIWKKRRYVQQHVRKVSDSHFMKRVKHNPRLAYYPSLFTGKVDCYED